MIGYLKKKKITLKPSSKFESKMLFLLAICFLIVPQQAFTRKQQSGFLDPFPTGNHQVAHEVPPKLNKGFREGYKSQKDSACKKLLTYTDGEVNTL